MNDCRIITTLLISKNGFIKTKRFNYYRYIGDPINTLRILNDQEAQEIIILDVDKKNNNQDIDSEYLKKITSECFSPLSYGGGIKTLDDVKKILKCGFEKIVFNNNLYENLNLIKSTINETGSQSVVACIDYVSSSRLLYKNFINGKNFKNYSLEDMCKYSEDIGVGEILLQAADRDGTFLGLDFETYEKISDLINIPIIISGGCNGYKDIKLAFKKRVHGISASSSFIFSDRGQGVLINYPNSKEIESFQINYE